LTELAELTEFLDRINKIDRIGAEFGQEEMRGREGKKLLDRINMTNGIGRQAKGPAPCGA
jgi:hypothetical protein